MPAITAGVGLMIAVALAIGARGFRARLAWLAAAAGVALVWRLAPALVLFLPPAAINVALGAFFASTLPRGREPRIARYARLERGDELPPDIARYARRLTWIWTVFFFASAIVGLLLAVAAPLAVWSAFANVVSYLLVAGLFVGEYGYRRLRFAHHRHASLLRTFRIVAQDGRFRRTPGRSP